MATCQFLVVVIPVFAIDKLLADMQALTTVGAFYCLSWPVTNITTLVESGQ